MALVKLLTDLAKFKYTNYKNVGANNSPIGGRHGGYKGGGEPPHPEEHSKFDDKSGVNLSQIKGRHGGTEPLGQPPHPEAHSLYDDGVGGIGNPQSFTVRGYTVSDIISGRHGGTVGPTPALPLHPDTHSDLDNGVGFGVAPNDNPQSFDVRGYTITGNKRFYIGWQGDFMNHPLSDYGIGAFNRIAGVFDYTQTRDRLRKAYTNYPEITFGADEDGGFNGLNGSIHIGNQDLPEVVGGGLSYYGNLNSITPRGSIYRADDGTYRVPQEGVNTLPPGGISNIPLFEGIKPESGFDRSLMYIPNTGEPSTPIFNQFTRSETSLIRIDRYSDNFDPDGDDVFDFPTTPTIPYNIPYHKPGEEHLQPFIIRDIGDVWGYSDTDLFTGSSLGKTAGFINAIAGEFLRAPPDVLIDRSKADITRIAKFLESPKGILFIAEQFILQAFNPTLETKVWNPLSLGSAVPLIHINRHTSIFHDVKNYTDALTFLSDSRIKFQSPLATVFGAKLPVDKRLLAVNPNKYDWPPAGGFAAAVRDAKRIEGSQSKVTGRAKKQSDGGSKDLFQKLSFNKYDSGNNIYLTKDGIMGTPEPDSPFGIIASLPLTVSEGLRQIGNALSNWVNSAIKSRWGSTPDVDKRQPPDHRFSFLEQKNTNIPISGPLLNSPLAAIMASYYPGMQGSYSFPTHISGDLWSIYGHNYQYPVTKGNYIKGGNKLDGAWGVSLARFATGDANVHEGKTNFWAVPINLPMAANAMFASEIRLKPVAQSIVIGDNFAGNTYYGEETSIFPKGKKYGLIALQGIRDNKKVQIGSKSQGLYGVIYNRTSHDPNHDPSRTSVGRNKFIVLEDKLKLFDPKQKRENFENQIKISGIFRGNEDTQTSPYYVQTPGDYLLGELDKDDNVSVLRTIAYGNPIYGIGPQVSIFNPLSSSPGKLVSSDELLYIPLDPDYPAQLHLGKTGDPLQTVFIGNIYGPNWGHGDDGSPYWPKDRGLITTQQLALSNQKTVNIESGLPASNQIKFYGDDVGRRKTIGLDTLSRGNRIFNDGFKGDSHGPWTEEFKTKSHKVNSSYLSNHGRGFGQAPRILPEDHTEHHFGLESKDRNWPVVKFTTVFTNIHYTDNIKFNTIPGEKSEHITVLGHEGQRNLGSSTVTYTSTTPLANKIHDDKNIYKKGKKEDKRYLTGHGTGTIIPTGKLAAKQAGVSIGKLVGDPTFSKSVTRWETGDEFINIEPISITEGKFPSTGIPDHDGRNIYKKGILYLGTIANKGIMASQYYTEAAGGYGKLTQRGQALTATEPTITFASQILNKSLPFSGDIKSDGFSSDLYDSSKPYSMSPSFTISQDKEPPKTSPLKKTRLQTDQESGTTTPGEPVVQMATAHWKGQKGFGTRLETKGKSTLTIEGKEELKSLKLINFPYFNDTGPGSNVGTEGQALGFIGQSGRTDFFAGNLYGYPELGRSGIIKWPSVKTTISIINSSVPVMCYNHNDIVGAGGVIMGTAFDGGKCVLAAGQDKFLTEKVSILVESGQKTYSERLKMPSVVSGEFPWDPKIGFSRFGMHKAESKSGGGVMVDSQSPIAAKQIVYKHPSGAGVKESPGIVTAEGKLLADRFEVPSDGIFDEYQRIESKTTGAGGALDRYRTLAYGDIPRGENPDNRYETVLKSASEIKTVNTDISKFLSHPGDGIRNKAKSKVDAQGNPGRVTTRIEIKSTGGYKPDGSDLEQDQITISDIKLTNDTNLGLIKKSDEDKYQTSLIDKVNMHPYGDEDNNDDFIKFKFFDLVNKKYIIFRASLSGISETISPEWSSERYIGRPDSVHVYQGVERSMSFEFMVVPTSKQELPVLWEKLNYLVGLTYPTWKRIGLGNRMEGPFMNLTIGDMYVNTPGFLSSLSITVDDNSPWELDEGFQLPHAISVSCEFTHIGKYPLASQGKHYDLGWLRKYDNTTQWTDGDTHLGKRPMLGPTADDSNTLFKTPTA